MAHRLKIKINHGFTKYTDGETITVAARADGVPKELYWRRRIKDAVVDGCIEIVKEAVKPVKKSRKSSDEDVTDGSKE